MPDDTTTPTTVPAPSGSPMYAAAKARQVIVLTRPGHPTTTARLMFWPTDDPARWGYGRTRAKVQLASGAMLTVDASCITLLPAEVPA